MIHRHLSHAVLAAVVLLGIGCETAKRPSRSDRLGGRSQAESPELKTHFLGRVSYGQTAGDMAELDRIGTRAYLAKQLRPNEIPENPILDAKLGMLPAMETPVGDPLWLWESLWADHILRARYTNRQLNEVMTEFWRNHFNTELPFGAGGRTGLFSSLDVDADGKVRVVHYNMMSQELRTAAFNGAHWVKETPDDHRPGGLYPSIRFDPKSGTPAITSYRPSWGQKGWLLFSRRDGDTWSTVTVDDENDPGLWSSLRFDAKAHPFIAYVSRETGDLKLAVDRGDGFEIEVVEPGAGAHSVSLALDSKGRPAIAYVNTKKNYLLLRRKTADGWVVQSIEPLKAPARHRAEHPSPPRVVSMEFDPRTGDPVIAYYRPSTGDLRIAYIADGGIRFEDIDADGDVGKHPSLAFHPNSGEPAIAYFDATRYDLKLAERDASGWQLSTVEASKHITGEWNSLGFAGDEPVISYYDGSMMNANLARRTSDGWQFGMTENLGQSRMSHTVWQWQLTQAFRENALGCFSDLLRASAFSPAMMRYLNNESNTATNGNENYARELLELHTLGVDAGYTQLDVETVARAFTGWGVKPEAGLPSNCAVETDGFCYDHASHDGDSRTVFGVSYPADGGVGESSYMKQGEMILDTLAHHPATAQFVCTKMVAKFIADEPPPRVHKRCIRTFLESAGDISRVLETILLSPEFSDPRYRGNKVKTPLEFAVAAIRNLDGITDGVSVFADVDAQGLAIFFETVPTGYPETGNKWVSPNSLLQRWRFVDELTHSNHDTTIDPETMVASEGLTTSGAVVDHFTSLLIGGRATSLERELLLEQLGAVETEPVNLQDPEFGANLRSMIQVVMMLPEYQKQ